MNQRNDRVKALALDKPGKSRGQRCISLIMMGSLVTLSSFTIGVWAAPKLEVYSSTTTLDATTTVANGAAVDLLLTGAAAPFPTTLNKTFTVKNSGVDPLIVSSFTLAQNANPVPAITLPVAAGTPLEGLTGTGTVNPKFSQPALTSTNIAPGATATFSVLFDTGATSITVLPNFTNPLYFLSFTGTVQIISNDGGTAGSLFKIPVNGTLGTSGATDIRILDDQGNEVQACGQAAPCTLAGATTPPVPQYNQIIDFGSVSLGGQPISKTFKLKNIGTGDATLTAAGATVANTTENTVGITAPTTLTASGFTVSTNYPTATPLAPGATTAFTVTFNPSTANTFGASINVSDNNLNMLPATNVVFPVKDNTATGVTLPTYFTTPATNPAAGIVNATVGRFGVVGRVTPLPIADVVMNGTTPIADGATLPIDFGVLLVGDATNNTKTFTIRNASVAPAVPESELKLTNPISLTGTGFSLTQAGSPNFAVTTLASSPPPAALNGTDFKVTMDTSNPGMFEGEVSFVTNDATKTPYNFKIKGAVVSSVGQEIEMWYGTPAEVTAGTATRITSGKPPALGTVIDFSTPIGADVIKTFTVRNTGGTPLTLQYLSTPLPNGFVLASVVPSVILGGQMASFDIQLNGQTAGTYGGTLNIFNDDKANPGDGDDLENPFNFQIKATVKVPAPEIQVLDDAGTNIDITVPTQIDFGKKPQGTNVPKIFTVKNVGDKDLMLSSAAVLSGSGFTLNSFNPGPVAPGATTTFTVTLDASAAGTFNGEVSFTDDDSDEGAFKFPVTAVVEATPPAGQTIELWYGKPADITAGTATPITDGTLTTSGTAIGMGNFNVGETVVKTFTIRNIGLKELQLYGAPSLNGISVVGAFPSSIPPQGEATFDVKVETSVATTGKPPMGGTFQIFNNDSSKTPFDFPLTATVGPLTPPSQSATLKVTVKGTGSVDSTAPAGVGITSCTVTGGSNCEAVLPPGTSAVTLTAIGGSVTWSGTDCKVGATPETAIVTVSPTATVVSCDADFVGAVTTLPLTVTVTGTGTGSVDSTTPAGIGVTGCVATGGTCAGNVPAGTTSVTLTAIPGDVNTTVTWGPGCAAGTEPNTGLVSIASGATGAECTVAFTAGTPPVGNLPMTIKVTGSGSVDSVVPKTLGIAGCAATNGTCTANIPTGTTTIVLSAKPVSGEAVTWGGSCDGTGYTGVVTVTSDMTTLAECTVDFASPPVSTTLPLTVKVTGNGTLNSTSPAGVGVANCAATSGTCTGNVPTGTSSVTLTATPGDANTTVTWGPGCAAGTEPLAGIVSIASGATATECGVTFTTGTPPVGMIPLTVKVTGNGSVASTTPVGVGVTNCAATSGTCTGNVPVGTTSVMLTATPGDANTTVTWSSGCVASTQPNTGVVTIVAMASAAECAVTFTTGTPPLANIPLTVKVTGNGSVDSTSPSTLGIKSCAATSGTCTANIPSGTTTVTLTAKPVSGETVTWGGGCTGTGNTGVVTATSGVTALECTVNFASTTTPPQTDSCFEVQHGVLLNGICRPAQQLLAGAVDAAGAPLSVKAEIVGGTAKAGGNYLSPATVTLADSVVVAGTIKVAPEDVNKTVDIIVAGIFYTSAVPNGYVWYMLNGKNNTCETCVEPWDFDSRDVPSSMGQLMAFKAGMTLPAYLPVQIYANRFVSPGPLDLFLGYRVIAGSDKGKIVFNSSPISVTILP